MTTAHGGGTAPRMAGGTQAAAGLGKAIYFFYCPSGWGLVPASERLQTYHCATCSTLTARYGHTRSFTMTDPHAASAVNMTEPETFLRRRKADAAKRETNLAARRQSQTVRAVL